MAKIQLCALLACLLTAGSAVAGPTVAVLKVYGYYAGDGGEFTLTPNLDLTERTGEMTTFQTFCLERSEIALPGSLYSVVVNDEAILGGNNNGPTGDGGGDPLDSRTAYLYSHFRAGTLTGYDYTVGPPRINSAKALQDVIWYLEDEMDRTWDVGSLQDQFLTAAQAAVNSGEWVGLGNVRVLNTYKLDHAEDEQYRNQDMLVTVTVPAPGAVALGVLGSCLVGFLRRRHRM